MTLILGAVADDFTGATDLANTLVAKGLRTVQLIGVPQGDVDVGDAEAVVIALKTRTAPTQKAVHESLAASAWLKARGAHPIIFKYCSTFDSTPLGNIGPIADAMLAQLDASFALVCPAFPGAARTIYKGHLFVGNQLLSDSPMKDHPLTPMRDSNLVQLMAEQSEHAVGLIDLACVKAGPDAIRAQIETLMQDGKRYGVVDVVADEDLMIIGQAARDHALVTGGSGIALGLPAALGAEREGVTPVRPKARGRALVLAGSCSAATRAQLANLPGHWPRLRLDPKQLALAFETTTQEVCRWIIDQPTKTPCVVYSSANPKDVARVQAEFGGETAGMMIERAMSEIAVQMTRADTGQLIVAGGETSGAVVSALGITALRIGPQISPGVPWCETLDGPQLALALKSGNFGAETFFSDALEMLA